MRIKVFLMTSNQCMVIQIWSCIQTYLCLKYVLLNVFNLRTNRNVNAPLGISGIKGFFFYHLLNFFCNGGVNFHP